MPDYWIPFLPKQVVTGGELELRLERAAMPLFGANGGIVGSIPPVGSLLRPSQSLVLYEEEVPREGIRVSRSSQYVRWLNGSTHLWRGTQKLPGRGEGSSGLRFDTVEQI